MVQASGSKTGLACLNIIKEAECDDQFMVQRLALAENDFKAAMEVLYMRAQYFHYITDHGIEEARQMAFLVEQGNDVVHSNSYRTARESPSPKLETETAKQLAKARLERANRN